MRKSLSLIVPVHNEEENILPLLDEIERCLKSKVSRLQIVVVDDGSSDRSPSKLAQAVTDNRITLVTHAVNRGYGAALRSGFAQATCEYVGFIDGDGQLDPKDLVGLLDAADSSTFSLGYRQKRQDNLARCILGAGFSKIFVPLCIGVRVRDVDCALKVFPRRFLSEVSLTADGALINAEMLAHAASLGYAFRQFPVAHRPRLSGEQSGAKLSVIGKVILELWGVRMRVRASHREMVEVLRPSLS